MGSVTQEHWSDTDHPCIKRSGATPALKLESRCATGLVGGLRARSAVRDGPPLLMAGDKMPFITGSSVRGGCAEGTYRDRGN